MMMDNTTTGNFHQLYLNYEHENILSRQNSNSDIMNKKAFEITTKPRCQICGSDESIGLNYNAVTCEACKKFFLRGINNPKNRPVVCERTGGKCVITVKNRADCFYCRWKKCKDEGMSFVKDEQSYSTIHIKCKVCFGTASGTHFGVATCEACKTFFKRNIEKFSKLRCPNDRRCDVTRMARSKQSCSACRLEKCLQVGMDLSKSKVGRQSNLAKRNLALSNAVDTTVVTTPSPTIAMATAEVANNYAVVPASNSESPESSLSQYSSIAINNTDTSNSIEISDTELFTDSPFLPYCTISNQNQYNNGDPNLEYQIKYIFQFLQQNAVTRLKACEKAELFSRLLIDDKKQLAANTVHSIRYVWLHENNKNLNYFNTNNSQFLQVLYQYFPVFEIADSIFQSIHEQIRNLNLDSKEYQLFSTLIMLTTGNRTGTFHLENISKKKSVILEELMNYMFQRRNEYDSNLILIHSVPNYSRLQLLIQRGFPENLRQLSTQFSISYTTDFEKFYMTV